MNIRILTADDVRAALPMDLAIEAMGSAFGQFSDGRATVPLREKVQSNHGVTLVMPAFLHQSEDLAVKIVSVYPKNPDQGLPTVAGTLLVLDPLTGMPRAFMDGDSLTAIRTGAAGGLATKLLARPEAATVALFGAGVQARAQLLAAMVVRKIHTVFILSRTKETARRLADEIITWPNPPEVLIDTGPQEAVKAADIIIAATTSRTPVFDGNDVTSGTHITGVGSFTPEMCEVDTTAISRATVFVDSRSSARAEAGDLIAAKADIAAELGEVINGMHPGRTSVGEITFFKSVGLAAQDAAAASAVLKAAEANDFGQVVSLT
jgi:ornithine cyclodeaminase/alanine dehydrogenase-like protein (mu-crystallin family)